MSTTTERAPVIEVDVGKHSSPNKPDIASRLEEEGAKLKEKRQSLTKEEVQNKLQQAEANRKEVLEEKIKTAKELEGHPTPKKE